MGWVKNPRTQPNLWVGLKKKPNPSFRVGWVEKNNPTHGLGYKKKPNPSLGVGWVGLGFLWIKLDYLLGYFYTEFI